MTVDASLGKFLKQLREGKGIGLREAAKEAGISSGYLSQVEGEKRGRRKTGEVFAPHPQLLQRLARVYHVPMAQLLERAGYLEPQVELYGYSEEQEVNRCFEFVIHDPSFKDALTTADKKAVLHRYEMLTGRKLITWAGDDDSVISRKPRFTCLRLERGLLYAHTPQQTLTADEVKQELQLDDADLEHFIKHGHLKGTKDDKGELVFHRAAVLSLKQLWQDGGRHALRARKQVPATPEEWAQAKDDRREQLRAAREKSQTSIGVPAKTPKPKKVK